MNRIIILCVVAWLSWDSKAQGTFTNPVFAFDFADPTVIRGHDGWFYAYATNTGVGSSFYHIQVARSKDLVAWERVGDALPQKPVWADKDFWAPHVLYDAAVKKYYLYYSGESNDENTGKCVGVAVSDKPQGPFVDSGMPLVCGETFVNIDPMAFDDAATGKKWLYWGSAHQPIRMQELSADRLSFKPGTSPVTLIEAGNDEPYNKLLEGAWLHFKNGYYYLFTSGDNCCGEQAHYAVMVARSKSTTGPFEKLSKTRSDKSSAILVKNNTWTAPGHNSVITDDAGQDWMVYHAIATDPSLKKKGRIMLIDRIEYKDGWPSVATQSPGTKPQKKPYIKN